MCATSILERFPSSRPNQHHEAGRHCWNTCCDAASTRVSLECIPLCIFDRYLIKSLWSEHELIRLTFRISQLETLSALGDLSHRQHPECKDGAARTRDQAIAIRSGHEIGGVVALGTRMKSQPFAARPRSTERASCLYALVQVDGAK